METIVECDPYSTAPGKFGNLITEEAFHEKPRRPRFEFDWSSVRSRLFLELQLFRTHIRQIITFSFLLSYVFTVVCRNVAFYFHQPLTDYINGTTASLIHHRLYDIGFELTPDLSHSHVLKNLNEVLQYITGGLTLATGLIPIIYTCKYQRPYLVNVGVRFGWSITTGHAMRALAYLSTSVPGPATHCIDITNNDGKCISEVRLHQPKTLHDIFFDAQTGRNCGDLIFSGHMLMIITEFCIITHYLKQITDLKTVRLISCMLIAFIGMQAFIVISTRNHYTVDVILGLMVGGLNWILHLYVLRPNDPEPHNLVQFGR